MATVIDSLVLEFNLDPRKFTAGQKSVLSHLKLLEEGAVHAGKTVETETKRLGESFAGMKRGLLAATAVFFAGKGIREFTSYLVGLDAATSRTAHTLNMSARELSAWQGAAEQTGGSAQGITSTITSLSGALNVMQLTGQAAFLPVLNQLGVRLHTANNELKTADQLLLDVAGALESIADPAKKSALLSMLPGMTPDSINLILTGRRAIEGYLDAARKAGGTTDKSAEATKEYQRQMALLDRSSTNLGRSLLTFLAPAIIKVADSLTDLFTRWNAEAGSKEDKAAAEGLRTGMEKRFGKAEDSDLVKWFLGPKTYERIYGKPMTGASGAQSVDEAGFVAGLGGGGMKLKPGSGSSSPTTRRMMGALEGLPGIEQVTALNDAYHKLLGGQHPAGTAMDLTIKDPSKSAEMTAAIKARLAEAGITARVINEYLNPSKGSTAPHIHVQLAPGAGLPAGATAAAGVSNTTTNRGGDTNTATTTVGPIIINAPGGDPNAIEKGLQGAFRRSNLAAPANYGQQ